MIFIRTSIIHDNISLQNYEDVDYTKLWKYFVTENVSWDDTPCKLIDENFHEKNYLK